MKHVLERLFSESPFKPLIEHAGRVAACVRLLARVSAAWRDDRFEDLESLHEEMSKLEHEADEIKRHIRDHLPRVAFLPVHRGDLLALLSAQDAISDSAEDVTFLLTLRRTPFPEGLHEPFDSFLTAILNAAGDLEAAIAKLDNLVEAGFGGPELPRLLASLDRVAAAEEKSDRSAQRLLRTLFALESQGQVDPVSLILLLRIFRAFSQIANQAENTADRLRILLRP